MKQLKKSKNLSSLKTFELSKSKITKIVGGSGAFAGFLLPAVSAPIYSSEADLVNSFAPIYASEVDI